MSLVGGVSPFLELVVEHDVRPPNVARVSKIKPKTGVKFLGCINKAKYIMKILYLASAFVLAKILKCQI